MNIITFTLRTSKKKEIIDITQDVEKVIAKNNINEGLCVVFVPHTTAALILNEYESNLKKDFIDFFDYILPKKDWAHNTIDDNAEAHLAAATLGHSIVLPVIEGRLIRGTWQNIILCEFDGPRERKVIVSLIHEK